MGPYAPIIPVTLRICDPGSESYSVWFARSTFKNPTGTLTSLIIASFYGHRAIIKVLVERGADIEERDGDGQTPLSHAAENGHEAIVQLLVEKGADIEAMDEDGWTPLSWAAQNGHEAVVQLLVEKGANIKAKDEDGWTPLSQAAQNGHEAIVRLLVDNSAAVKSNLSIKSINQSIKSRKIFKSINQIQQRQYLIDLIYIKCRVTDRKKKDPLPKIAKYYIADS